VTSRHRDHIGWYTSKITVRLGYSLFADPNITDLFQGEHPEILTGIGEGYRKSGFRRTKALICVKRDKIGPRLLLTTNRKSHRPTRFRLVQNQRLQMISKRDSRSLIDTVYAPKLTKCVRDVEIS